MVDFRKLSDKAKDLVEKRGGSESLKQDAGELKSIATGKGSLSEKAKAAAAALKDPGGKAGAPSAAQKPPARPASKPSTKGGAAKGKSAGPKSKGGRKKSGKSPA